MTTSAVAQVQANERKRKIDRAALDKSLDVAKIKASNIKIASEIAGDTAKARAKTMNLALGIVDVTLASDCPRFTGNRWAGEQVKTYIQGVISWHDLVYSDLNRDEKAAWANACKVAAFLHKTKGVTTRDAKDDAPRLTVDRNKVYVKPEIVPVAKQGDFKGMASMPVSFETLRSAAAAYYAEPADRRKSALELSANTARKRIEERDVSKQLAASEVTALAALSRAIEKALDEDKQLRASKKGKGKTTPPATKPATEERPAA